MVHNNGMTNRDIMNLLTQYANEVAVTMERFGNDYNQFIHDFVFFNALSMPIYQFAEQTLNLSEDAKELFGDICWHAIRGMRNLFAHAYGTMSPIDIWETATTDIPLLADKINVVLNSNSHILDTIADGRKS
ncbi:HepT-like ribonuclease domain-containing protein [Weissella paramesenteroides]